VYEKYTNDFLESGRASEAETYITLFGKLEEYDKFILEWDKEDLEIFLKSLSSVSVNSINKYLQYIREFHKYITEIDGVEYKKLEIHHDLKNYIDLNKLLSVTINESQYKMLRRLLTIDSGDYTYNSRDAAILILAYNLLDNAEIKNLMKDDIKFYELAGREVCEIRLKNRYTVIEDKEEIDIIKKTMKEYKYFVTGTNKKREHTLDLKDTKAFIRPVHTRSTLKQTVANPSEILARVLDKIETIPGTSINLYDFSIESIRRSRIIQLLRSKDVNIDNIKNILKKSSSCDLYWLSEISMLIERESNIKGS
jgi:site-specific recombinase XerD